MNRGLDLTFHADELALLVRLLVATLAGAAVGWNRHRAGKPAGIGTYSLVSLGAAIFVSIPIWTGAPGSDAGATRVIQGVAAGIGFLGAGEIFRDPSSAGSVQGLTSAAALWVTAALGILAVCGSTLVIAVATTLTLLVLFIAPRIERLLPARNQVKDQPRA